MKLISAESAEILGDDDPDLTVLHIGNHLLERGPLEIAAGEAIVYIEAGIGKVVVFREFFQDIFLRQDLSRYVFAKECAIRIDKQQKERYNNAVIDNDIII